MAERPRFFTVQQKLERAKQIGGWRCEGWIDKFTRCTQVVLEGHHDQGFSHGGETTTDNESLLCKAHHAWIHITQGEPWAARLIIQRMDEGDINVLKLLGINPGGYKR